VQRAEPGERTIGLRIPAWCKNTTLDVAGERQAIAPTDGVVALSRAWQAGEVIELMLPMPVRIESRPNGAISLHTGPLTLAYCPGEIWRGIPDTPGLGDWEVYPRGSWNFGLEVEADAAELPWPVERQVPGVHPFELASAPVRVPTRGRFIHEWQLHNNSAAPPPPSPVTTNQTPRPIALVPYGCARLRVCEFPRVDPVEFTGEVFD